VSLALGGGETLGLVGESGCGKTTLSRLILRLIEPTAGSVVLDGEEVTSASRGRLRELRRRMQLIFQDPTGSLNPRMRVGDIVAEPLVVHGIGVAAARRDRVVELLERVGLSADDVGRYPHEFSGGQRQRIGIARALAPSPSLLICDEPVSALDVSVQSQILNLLADLRAELGLAMLFIAHDLAVVRHVSDRIAVMYKGRIVERAATQALFETPKHPYTQALLAAVPEPDPAMRMKRLGPTPEPGDDAICRVGCGYALRCPIVEDKCRVVTPQLEPAHGGQPDQFVACHIAE
jgi:oligopeptide/dipeptide ABC transporter ATP-binding protein